ncbi:MAG: hypothetical protein WD894_25225 [Pirellulales bacterium]
MKAPSCHAPPVCSAVALLFIVLGGAGSASSATGFRVMLPGWPQKQATPFAPAVAPAQIAAPTTPAAGNTTGLVLTLDTTWLDGNGYRPVRVTVTPTAPTQADRSLRVSFRPDNSIAVTRDIELPAGFTSVTTTLSVPQVGPWYTIAFDVFEDGEHLRELSFPRSGMGIGMSQYSGDNASPSILMLNSAANSSMILNAMSRAGQPVLQVGPSNSISTSITILAGNPRRQLLVNQANTIPTLADLPDRWIDYSILDVIVASRQDLQTLVELPQWRAIRRWILAGGSLWVYDVGVVKPNQSWRQWNLAHDKPWANLDELNKWIDFPTEEQESLWPEVPALRGWRAGDPSMPLTFPNQYFAGSQIVTTPADTVPGLPSEAESGRKEPKFPFAMRPFGQGIIVAIPDVDPTNNPNFVWQEVFNNVGPEQWHWPTRNGVNFTSPNENYWNFLIPGVGAAPVTAFQVLITLFVLAIGPLNFYLLRRWHKLNLLLVTVPVSAAVVTVALLLYAVFSDGFGVRVRTRSFTELNQQTGEATCLGRITYYAGLTPSKGLSFSGDITVYPLSESPIATQFDAGGSRRLAWSFDGDDDAVGMQQLESGWLQSRVQTQLVTVRARKTRARVAIASERNRASSVTNELGVSVSILLVRDAAGDYSVARDLAHDAQSKLAPLTGGEVPTELTAIERDKALQPPDGVQLGGSDSIFGIRRQYYGRRFINPGMPMSVMQTGMLEQSLSETLRAAVEQGLPPRSYVAIVERSPEFELGLESAEDESSLHVIYGRW